MELGNISEKVSEIQIKIFLLYFKKRILRQHFLLYFKIVCSFWRSKLRYKEQNWCLEIGDFSIGDWKFYWENNKKIKYTEKLKLQAAFPFLVKALLLIVFPLRECARCFFIFLMVSHG